MSLQRYIKWYPVLKLSREEVNNILIATDKEYIRVKSLQEAKIESDKYATFLGMYRSSYSDALRFCTLELCPEANPFIDYSNNVVNFIIYITRKHSEDYFFESEMAMNFSIMEWNYNEGYNRWEHITDGPILVEDEEIYYKYLLKNRRNGRYKT